MYPLHGRARIGESVLVVAVFLANVFVSDDSNPDIALRPLSEVPTAALLVFAVASAALYWRRHRPLSVLGVSLGASVASIGLGFGPVVALFVSLYSAGRYGANNQWNYIGLGAALIVIGSTAFNEEVTAPQTGFGLILLFVVWYIGRRIRLRGERVGQLEWEQAAEARRVVADERSRIARELHDVVAHRVSLMTVQAGAAKTVAADDPVGAIRAMEAVEQAGRQALDELRHLLGVLRPEADVDGLGPQPGLADVPRLVDQFAEAGLDISLTMDGVDVDLPARVDLSTYRIVQEALTNVLKHAGPSAQTEVRISTDNSGIAIKVLDNGHGATILPGAGHGIVGMRERASLLGGSLEAGPRPGGGFQIVAYLPLTEEPA